MSNRPRRGPIVAHGLAAMLAQARPIERAATTAPSGDFARDLQAQRDAETLVQRARAAEDKLLRVAQVCVKFREQCAQQPEGSLARTIAETIIGRLEEELAK